MSRTTDPHRVRRTMIDDCGAISTARRLEACARCIPRASTEGSPLLARATVLPRGERHPSGSSSSGVSWKRRSRLDGHPTEPRNVRRSHVRESGACSRTLIWTDCSDSGAERIPQLIKALGDTPSPPVPGARHLAERSVKAALGRTPRGRYAECVPRPRRDLTTAEKRHLHSLEGRIGRLEAELHATRREWAELVEEAGQAAVARELGVSRQAVADRLRRIRANRVGRSGRR